MLYIEQLDISQCHGCGLCALVCPVYQQDGKVTQTPHGMAKIKQAGGELDSNDAMGCVLCGACAPMCPQSINLMQLLIDCRRVESETHIDVLPDRPCNRKGETVLIADSLLLEYGEYIDQIVDLLGDGIQLADDQGADISLAMREGVGVSYARLHQFLTSLQPVKKIIISDGLLFQLIQSKLPQIPMQSLGQALSSLGFVRQEIKQGDLYVMDSQTYHADYDKAVIYYDNLHKQSGCNLSRDLHRLAIATGAQAVNDFEQGKQVEWLLEGLDIERIVTESIHDQRCIAEHSNYPVVYIAELAGGQSSGV